MVLQGVQVVVFPKYFRNKLHSRLTQRPRKKEQRVPCIVGRSESKSWQNIFAPTYSHVQAFPLAVTSISNLFNMNVECFNLRISGIIIGNHAAPARTARTPSKHRREIKIWDCANVLHHYLNATLMQILRVVGSQIKHSILELVYPEPVT